MPCLIMNDMAKALSRKVTIYINGKEVESTIKSLTSEMDKLKKQQRGMIIGSEEYVKTSLKIKEIDDVLKAQKAAIQSVGESWEDTRKAVADYSTILYGLKVATGKIAGAYNWAKGYVEEAAKMDDAYADVMKTTGLTHDEVLRLNEAFEQMDTRTSREELNKLAYEAGKLGINSAEAVAQFVSAADKINIALGDVLGDGAMVTIGKLTNIYESVSSTLDGKNLEEKMLAIGSAVNSLGQASTANEGYMVEFMKRLGGIASQAKLSADQVLGYASALDQNGQAVEMAATAFMKLIQQMVKKPEEFVQAAGVSMEEFKRMMDEDMNGAIMRVLEGMEKGGGFQQLIGMFADMGLDGARAATVVSSLAKHLDQVREAQALANTEMQTGTSVTKEFNTKNETMQAQAEKAKKRFEEVRIELGNELYPVLIHLQRTGTVLMKGFAGWVQLVKAHPALLLTIAGALAAWNKERVLSAALWVRERPAAIAEWWQRRQNHKAILDETAASARLRLERVKALQQRIKERIAIQESILARGQELVAIGQGNQVLKAEASLRRLKVAQTKAETLATNASTAATKASAAALRTIPLMLLITALTTIGTKLWEAWRHSQRFNKEMSETNKAITEQTTEATYLFDRLERVTKGSTEYYTILNKLNSLYPEIISKYKNEKGELDQVAAARQRVIDKIRQQVVEQRRLDKLGSIAGDFADEQTKALQMMQEYMTRKFGKKKGQSMYEEFAAFLPQGFDEKADYAALRKKYEELSGEDMGMMFGWNRMLRALGIYTNAVNEAYKETEKFNDLYSSMGSQGDDPFELAGKSAERLQAELTAAEKRLAEYDKRKKSGKSSLDATDYKKMYDDEKKHVDALKAAISALNKEKSGGEDSGGSATTSYTTPAESEKERKAREKAEAAWNRFQQTYEQTMARVKTKTLSGLEAVNAEVDVAIGKMRAMLEAKEVSDPRAAGMLQDLLTAAEAWKKAKFDEYVGKIDKELQKLQKSAARDSDNEILNKAKSAAEIMRQSYDSTSTLIEQLQADLRNLDAQVLILRDDESAEAAARRTELNDEIEQLEEKVRLLREARSALTESVFHAIDLSVDTGDFGKKQQVQHHEQTNEDLKGLNFIQRFIGVGKEYSKLLDEINTKYDKYQKQLEQNAITARYMAQVERERGNENKAQEYEEQAAALEEQSIALKGLSEDAKKLAGEDALTKTLNKWIEGFEKLGDKALSIWGNITTMLNNVGDQELQDAENRKDEHVKILDEQLEQNLLSQEEYNEKKDALDNEYASKEKAIRLEQWERNQALSYGEAVIEGAAAVLKALNDKTIPSTAARIAMAGVMAAQTLTQIMAIAKQPKPYARGGYVERETVYKAGEAGPEWVASNRLLKDPQTAPVIEALEAYQRGDRRALSDIPMAQLNMPVATAAARELGRRSVGAIGADVARVSQRTEPRTVTVQMPEDGEIMKLWRELAAYLKDPNNRRAVISRQTMTDFERDEQFLRNRARL